MLPHVSIAGVSSDWPVAMLCRLLKIFNIASAWIINLASSQLWDLRQVASPVSFNVLVYKMGV